MADWIKVDVNLPTKSEVFAIAEDIGKDRRYVAGLLIQVWGWADAESENGYVPSVTEKAFDVVFGVTGLAKAMTKVGWLLIEKRGITIPNFDRHNSKSAKQRALSQRRMANMRDADSVTEASPDKRESKRESKRRVREEDTENIKIAAAPLVQSPKSETEPAVVADEKAGNEIGETWGNGRIKYHRDRVAFSGITKQDFKRWGEAYPACDVDLELKQMAEWVNANPAKGKKSRYATFITNWLSRTQDKGGSNRGTNRQTTSAGAGQRGPQAPPDRRSWKDGEYDADFEDVPVV